jgi:hypothetical protein
MKANMKYVIPLTTIGIAAAIACVAGPSLIITPPTVVISAPPPVVVAPTPVVAPDYYAWDGYEYVGVVGDQYYYLGPGNAWVVMDPVRLQRFHAWSGSHPDWRTHATHNVLYRNMDRHDAPQPMMHNNPPAHVDSHEAAPHPDHVQPQHAQPDHAPDAGHNPPH